MSSVSGTDQARFLPGAVVAGRYRIAGLLGRGGMGEVYRADDLRLGQPVALKFLPEAFEQNPDRLQRFLGEVRTARQVTHPNVCRVHDLGEADGQHYLSMEYVDGEDLGTLLRRIGRLPEDKAVQLARQICAGVAAAHEQGILHRDLKPANVMIDGRGRARITDFGLAGLAEGFAGAEVRAGTPAYMAPEQLSGSGVSVKSDLYALGLVLYELFTGKAAFEADTTAELMRRQQETSPTSPTSHVSGLDPAVERVILRCLEKDPAQRPESALAIAAALPGGDPLAAALAAGETPSPEMVAAAGPEGGLKPAVALACAAFAIAGILGVAAVAKQTSFHGRLPLDKPMAGLVENAREIIAELGYEEPPRGRFAHFDFEADEFRHLNNDSVSVWSELKKPAQRMINLHYRQSPRILLPLNFFGGPGSDDPAPDPGDIDLRLDLRGKLLALQVRPVEADFSTDPAPQPDWAALFEAAGLDPDVFAETAPTIQPNAFADQRKAWTGTLADVGGDASVRIEAAAFRGKPVAFRMVRPFENEWSAAAQEDAGGSGSGNVVATVGLLFVLASAGGAVALALRNFRMGRGDRNGAMRMALFVFAMRLLNWLIGGYHVASLADVVLFVIALGSALLLGAVTWVLYMALEPYVRRLWPQAIVGWSRLLAGRLRDPLVGRDVLVGVALGVALRIFSVVTLAIAEWRNWIPAAPEVQFTDTLRGGRFVLGKLFTVHLTSVAFMLGLLLLFLLFRLVLRRQWIASMMFIVLFALLNLQSFSAVSAGGTPTVRLIFLLAVGALNGGLIIVLLVRFGLLASGAAIFVGGIVGSYPLTLEFSAPYVGASLFAMGVVAAYALYGLRVSMAGRPVFQDGILQG